MPILSPRFRKTPFIVSPPLPKCDQNMAQKCSWFCVWPLLSWPPPGVPPLKRGEKRSIWNFHIIYCDCLFLRLFRKFHLDPSGWRPTWTNGDVGYIFHFILVYFSPCEMFRSRMECLAVCLTMPNCAVAVFTSDSICEGAKEAVGASGSFLVLFL